MFCFVFVFPFFFFFRTLLCRLFTLLCVLLAYPERFRPAPSLPPGSQGRLRPTLWNCVSRVASGQESWISRCWTQFFLQAPDFDPEGRIKVQFRALSPNYWRQVEDLCYSAETSRWEGEGGGSVSEMLPCSRNRRQLDLPPKPLTPSKRKVVKTGRLMAKTIPSRSVTDMDPWRMTPAWRWRRLRRLCLHHCLVVPPLCPNNG